MNRIAEWIMTNNCLICAVLMICCVIMHALVGNGAGCIGWLVAAIWAWRCHAAERLMYAAVKHCREADRAIADLAARLRTNTRWGKSETVETEGGAK